MTMFLLTFVAGAIIGAAIVWMLCNCCCKTSCCSQQGKEKSDTTGIREISVQTANAYFKAYLNYPISVDTMQAYSINPEQYNATTGHVDSDLPGLAIDSWSFAVGPLEGALGF